MKKILLFTFLSVTILAIFNKHSFGYETEKIEFYDNLIEINKNGTINVTERITYNFGSNEKHGITREIPLIKTNDEGKNFILTINNVEVENYPAEITKSRKHLSLRIGDPDKLISGTHTYTINYQVVGALTYFEDHDELFWNTVGTESEVPVTRTTTKLILPHDIKDGVDYICYTGVKDSKESNCDIQRVNEAIFFNSTKPLEVNETLTIAVKFPKGYADVLLPKEDRFDIFIAIVVIVLLTLYVLWNVVVPILTFLKWRKDRVNTRNHQQIVAAWFEPPEREDRKKFSPAETLAIISKSTNHSAISATIIYLAQQGFFTISVDEKGKVAFKKKTDTSSSKKNLTQFEKDILNSVTDKDKDSIDLETLKKSTKFYKVIASFQNKVLNHLYENGYFQDDPKKIQNKYMILFVLAMITISLLPMFTFILLGYKSFAKTLKGIQKYSEALSLKNFLSSQDEQLNFQSKNQMFFEKLLPYATAFGVEKVWADRFSDLKFTQSDWCEGDILNATTYSTLSRTIDSGVTSAKTYGSSGKSRSGFSSGFSSGGSSGGGGGGGSVGSW
ncbi:DUF2207 domain-containing protein [Patescibacteria group bacterium]|nr:DUF2207 domain-containing protein [Patescibacteria group bacterium]